MIVLPNERSGVALGRRMCLRIGRGRPGATDRERWRPEQMRRLAFILFSLLLAGCSWLSPKPHGFALTFRDVTLSRQQPSDAEFQVRLLQIAPDGTTELEALATGEKATARPGATFEFPLSHIYGIQLLSSSPETSEAVLTQNKCVVK
jgi:hypothetical protein